MGDGLVTVSGLAGGSCVTIVVVSAGIVVISKVLCDLQGSFPLQLWSQFALQLYFQILG